VHRHLIDYRKAHSFAFLFKFDVQQKSNFECKQGIKARGRPPQVLLEQWVLQYWGRSNTYQQRFAIGLWFGQKFFNLAFCSYFRLQYFNWAAVPGRRISNPPTSQSPIVVPSGCDSSSKFNIHIQKNKNESKFINHCTLYFQYR
jgi:hypothetical protein